MEYNVKCPHCGKGYTYGNQLPGAKIPDHWNPGDISKVCPGSGQTPRSTVDKRPLWKDEK